MLSFRLVLFFIFIGLSYLYYYTKLVQIVDMNRNLVFVDFSFFRNEDNQIILKELGARDLKGVFGFHHVYLPPFSIDTLSSAHRFTAKWQVRYLEMIDWETGYLDYTEHLNAFDEIAARAKDGKILVKGLEKAKYLKKRLRQYDVNIIEMEEEFHTPSFKDLKKTYPAIAKLIGCSFNAESGKIKSDDHNQFHNCCVLSHIHLLIQWYSEQYFINTSINT